MCKGGFHMKKIEMPESLNAEAVMMGLQARRKISLEKAIERFIEDKELSGLQKVTIDNYRQQASVFDAFCKARSLRTEDIRSIRTYHIQEYQKWLISERGVSTSTINSYCKTMKIIFDSMQKKKLIESNPFREVDKIKVGKQAVGFTPTKEELQRCINYQLKKADNFIGFRNLIILVFLADTGARVNETINVKQSHIHLSESGKEHVIINHSKNGTPRKIGLSNRLCNLLREYLPLIEHVNSEYLFISQRMSRISKREVQFIIKEIGVNNALPELTCHSLRRHFASVKVQQKIPLVSLMRLMGHSSMQVSLRYIQEFSEEYLEWKDTGIE